MGLIFYIVTYMQNYGDVGFYKKMVQEKITPKVMDIAPESIMGKPTIDISDYAFVETTIEKVEVRDYSNDSEERIRFVIETSALDKDNKVRAREFVTLFRDENHKLVFSENPKSNAQKILSFFKADDFSKLVGKKCKAVVRVSDSGKERLGIYFGA